MQRIFGKHAALEALKFHQHNIVRVLCTQKILDAWKQELSELNVQLVTSDYLNKHTGNAIHQGIVVYKKYQYKSIKDCYEDKRILILDNLQDPNNLGTIIRSMAAFNFSTLIIQKNHTCKITDAVAKSACGALEHINIITVSNLLTTLQTLAQHNFWCVSLDFGKNTYKADVDKIALIVGSEGVGLRPIIRKQCEMNLSIDTSEHFSVLNVAIAASIGMFITRSMKGTV